MHPGKYSSLEIGTARVRHLRWGWLNKYQAEAGHEHELGFLNYFVLNRRRQQRGGLRSTSLTARIGFGRA